MRICLVNTYHYRRGGDSTYTFDLAELLKREGHDVIHFAMHHPRNEKSEFEKYFADEVDFKRVFTTGSIPQKVGALFRSLYSRDARRRFSDLLDRTRPDIVHVQNFRRHLTFSVVEEVRRRKIPVIYTAHDYDPICPNSLLFADGKVCEICKGRYYYRALRRRCKEGSLMGSLAIVIEGTFVKLMRYYRHIETIVTPSEFLRNKLIEGGFDPSRIVTVHNFIDSNRYQPSYTGHGIIYYGRLAPEKGLIDLVRAAREVPDVEVFIAGDGPLRDELEKARTNLGATNVTILGYVEREKLLDLVSQVAAVVMPSIWYENFPYAILEAFAAGKPVIASRIGGMPEIVLDGETGFLFEPGDWLALAKHMLYLEKNPEVTKSLGIKARQLVEEDFNADKHYEKLSRIYERAIRG